MQWSDRVGRRLKLRDLHILLAVAKSGSMGKAAADLNVGGRLFHATLTGTMFTLKLKALGP